MAETLRASDRERRQAILRRFALVAAFAIVAGALLPLAHGGAGHAGDCGVCTVLAHGSAGVGDTACAPSLPIPNTGPALERIEPVAVAPLRDVSLRLARAPPLRAVSV